MQQRNWSGQTSTFESAFRLQFERVQNGLEGETTQKSRNHQFYRRPDHVQNLESSHCRSEQGMKRTHKPQIRKSQCTKWVVPNTNREGFHLSNTRRQEESGYKSEDYIRIHATSREQRHSTQNVSLLGWQKFWCYATRSSVDAYVTASDVWNQSIWPSSQSSRRSVGHKRDDGRRVMLIQVKAIPFRLTKGLSPKTQPRIWPSHNTRRTMNQLYWHNTIVWHHKRLSGSTAYPMHQLQCLVWLHDDQGR